MAGSLGNITKEIEMPKKIERSGAAMPDCGNENGAEIALGQGEVDGKDKFPSSAIQEIPTDRCSRMRASLAPAFRWDFPTSL